MAYNEFLADRITDILKSKSIGYEEKKMFGGLCYMVDDKMCFGIINNDLMARVGPEVYESCLKKSGIRPMEFTGRPMKGYVFAGPAATQDQDGLEYWIDLCLAFNPLAPPSKKKK